MNNRLIQRMLKQVAVYWEPVPGVKDDHGRQVWTAPVEIRCRWDDVSEEFLDKKGNVAYSKAKVYVGQDVKDIGVLWLAAATPADPAGTALGELLSLDDPFGQTNGEAYEIRRKEEFPNFRANNTLRTCYL